MDSSATTEVENDSEKDTVPTLKSKSKRRKRSVTPDGMLRRTNCFGSEEFVDRTSAGECLEAEASFNKELDNYLDDISREPTKKFRTHKPED